MFILQVNGAVGLNPSKGPGYSTATNASSASSTSPTHSYGAPAPPSDVDSAAGSNLNSQSSAEPPAEDLYADMEGEEELMARAQNPLPTLSADGLRALAQKQDGNKNDSHDASLPPLSASGLAKLAELYNPEDVTEDDEEEGLVIDTTKPPEDPMKDTEKISEDEDEQIIGNPY